MEVPVVGGVRAIQHLRNAEVPPSSDPAPRAAPPRAGPSRAAGYPAPAPRPTAPRAAGRGEPAPRPEEPGKEPAPRPEEPGDGTTQASSGAVTPCGTPRSAVSAQFLAALRQVSATRIGGIERPETSFEDRTQPQVELPPRAETSLGFAPQRPGGPKPD